MTNRTVLALIGAAILCAQAAAIAWMGRHWPLPVAAVIGGALIYVAVYLAGRGNEALKAVKPPTPEPPKLPQLHPCQIMHFFDVTAVSYVEIPLVHTVVLLRCAVCKQHKTELHMGRFAIEDPGRGPLVATRTQVVRDVALKTESISVQDWIQAVSAAMSHRAEDSKATRDSLQQLL